MSNAHDRQSVLQVSPEDNLLVALRDLEKGEQVEWKEGLLTVAEDIPAKHKLATCDLSEGDPSYMYGVLVGEATKPIGQGQRINTDNLVHRSADYQQANPTATWTPPSTEKWNNRTFQGFHRQDGSVGTANHWLVLPMVFCENGNVEKLKNSMLEALGFERRNQYQRFARDLASVYSEGLDPDTVSLPDEDGHSPSPVFPNVDGIKFLRDWAAEKRGGFPRNYADCWPGMPAIRTSGASRS